MSEPTAHELDDLRAARLVPERDPAGHKGSFGHVLVVAGSLDYLGAALMAGSAAMRSGCGLVTLCVPATLQPLVAGRVPELITLGLPQARGGEVDAIAAAAELAERAHDALLVGPGLQRGRGTDELVRRLLEAEGPPALVDAGALHVLAAWPGWWDRLGRAIVLTPHPGEFGRLGREAGTSDGERRRTATAAAADWRQVLVLKGAGTVVAAPDGRVEVAPFRLPALATAGSGDILSGVVASLLAQALEPFEAATLGVYLHGSAAAHVSEQLGDAGLMATDLLTAIPRMRRHLDRLRQRAISGRLGFRAPGATG